MGILLAIGFYIAPVIITVVFTVIAGIFTIIGSLLGRYRRRNGKK